jgi:hypothetical protein
MKATWAEATTAFAAGNAVEAASKGNSVRQTGNEVLQQLGMTPG